MKTYLHIKENKGNDILILDFDNLKTVSRNYFGKTKKARKLKK